MDPIHGANSFNANQNNLFTSESDNNLGKEDFLMLLITQLENQDPLNPSDPTEFVSQLAQFSSLEQLVSTNKNLEIIQGYQNSLESSMAIKYFGKEIVATGNAIEHESGTLSEISFALPEDAMKVNINIYDQSGRFIDNIEMGEVGSGEHSVEWTGKDSNMDDSPTGIYLFDIQAIDYEENKIATETFIEGVVTGVKFNQGKIFLSVGEKIVPLSSVLEVNNIVEEETPELEEEIDAIVEDKIG